MENFRTSPQSLWHAVTKMTLPSLAFPLGGSGCQLAVHNTLVATPLDTKSAIKHARRFKRTRNLFYAMRICYAVVLSYLDADFQPQCPHQYFWIVCCGLLPKYIAHPGP